MGSRKLSQQQQQQREEEEEEEEVVSTSEGGKGRSGTEHDVGRSGGGIKALPRRLHSLAAETIFATVFRIGKTEGIPALYGGLGGGSSKAFLRHGTTMLSKEAIHKLGFGYTSSSWISVGILRLHNLCLAGD